MRRVRANDGASAVEFAIVLPVLVLFVFGIIEFGMAFFRSQGMEAAVREGGRVAAVGHDGTAIAGAVRDGVGLVPIDPDDLEICIADVDEGGAVATEICGTATVGGFDSCAEPTVRVTARVVQNQGRYSIGIPLGPSAEPDYEASAHFRCEVYVDDD